jgi:hypothetical protein
MDESPDHEPTLIERGMGIHLNNLIAARRGTRNSRPARWELRTPNPPSRGGTTKGRTNKSESPPRSPRTGPGVGARRTATPPGYAPNARERQHMRMAPPSPAETPPRPAEINTSHNDDAAEKTLKEYTHSSKASGARPAGLLARPHGIEQQPGGKKVPSVGVSICGVLTDTPADAQGLLTRTAIRVPQKTEGNPFSSVKKQNTNDHGPVAGVHGPGGPSGPPGQSS